MVENVALHKWSVDTEPELTREAYALVDGGGAEECGCEACFNFATSRHLVYSPEVLEFLDELGIDPLLEGSVEYVARLDTGEHAYTVRFYLVGRIASGPATPVARRGGGLCESLEEAADAFVGFSADAHDAPSAFSGLPCVCLEVHVTAPWVSNAEEPGLA